MDWQESMNQAMAYIEENLTSEIDYAAAAQYMHCSEWEFRRLFSFIAQIPLSEYIRRRRLTRAAMDIQQGARLMETALHYGYESQAAFSRAFRQLHGVAPSSARDKQTPLNPFPRLTFKLILMEGTGMEKSTDYRPNIIGAGEVGYAVTIDCDVEQIHQINSSFWDSLGNNVLGTTALPFYGAFVSEEKCQLLGNLAGKTVLEIGCGTGHSLQYVSNRGAEELWGIDISTQQLDRAKEYLDDCGLSATLICSSMEEDCGIPKAFFDTVYSVYAIGWATDLDKTFSLIASYLKPGGTFIFSWSHPIHKCVAVEGDRLTFKKSYFDESWYSVSLGGGALSLADRKLSTYINALARAGFMLEELVEESDEDMVRASSSEFGRKASMLPATFVIKATKR